MSQSHVPSPAPSRRAVLLGGSGSGLWLLGLALLLSLTLWSATGRATTFVDVTVEQLAAASDLVVLGRVEHVDVSPTGPSGQAGIHTRATVQIRDSYRGANVSTLLHVWVQGGQLGDHARVVPGQARFQVGETYVLFLFEQRGALFPTGMARGAWHVPSGRDPRVGAPPEGLNGIVPATLADLAGRVRATR